MTPLSTIEGIARTFETFRRRVYIALAVGFTLWISATVFVVVGYLSSQEDFHRGSCTSRLVLRQLLERARDQTAKTPTSPSFTPEERKRALDFYADSIPRIEVRDCADIHLPANPPSS